MSSAEAIRATLARFGPALLDLAAESIDHGLGAGGPVAFETDGLPEPLQHHVASFVTLRIDGELRGCTGTAEAWRPLAVDVAENAHRSAFGDPRFPPLAAAEARRLEIAVSLLTATEPMAVDSEADLLARMVPGRDGLILEDRGRRALFLPQVWDMLDGAEAFLHHLKLKAGLDPDHWSDTIRFGRFRAFTTARQTAGAGG